MDRGAHDGVPDLRLLRAYCVERPLGCANRATGIGEIQLPLRERPHNRVIFWSQAEENVGSSSCDRYSGFLAVESGLSWRVSLLWTHCSQDRVTHEKDVGQRRGREYPMGVLRQSAIAHLVEAEHALDHSDRMLYP
jgi:hypothetical protein